MSPIRRSSIVFAWLLSWLAVERERTEAMRRGAIAFPIEPLALSWPAGELTVGKEEMGGSRREQNRQSASASGVGW